VLTDDAQPRLGWRDPLIWLIYPAIYLVFAIVILNHTGRRVPYYFLDVDRIGVVGLTVNACLLAAMFLGVGYGVVLFNRLRALVPTDTTVKGQAALPAAELKLTEVTAVWPRSCP
jgi:hypothetical protein